MAAIYCADIFCDDCAEDIRKRIARELWDAPIGTVAPDGSSTSYYDCFEDFADYLECMNERDYDSGEYPKYCSDDEESDSPQHCGSHDDCINHGELPDGFRYGYCFGNALTTDGEDYVKEAVREGDDDGVARLVWAVEYDYIDFDTEEGECEECGSTEDIRDDLCDDCAHEAAYPRHADYTGGDDNDDN
jgi:hypothetical protein